MTVRLNDPIRNVAGEVSTLNAELAVGRAQVTKVENFVGARGASRVAYFVDLEDRSGFEIGKMAYESLVERGLVKEA